jgi:hypothetical protein
VLVLRFGLRGQDVFHQTPDFCHILLSFDDVRSRAIPRPFCSCHSFNRISSCSNASLDHTLQHYEVFYRRPFCSCHLLQHILQCFYASRCHAPQYYDIYIVFVLFLSFNTIPCQVIQAMITRHNKSQGRSTVSGPLLRLLDYWSETDFTQTRRDHSSIDRITLYSSFT